MSSSKKKLEKGKIDSLSIILYMQKHTKKKTNRKLRETGHNLCKDCNGTGHTKKRQMGRYMSKYVRDNLLHLCSRCDGKGFRDWVGAILR